jgi:hypothetical protein
MSERQLLSSKEVDTILKATQEPGAEPQHSLDTPDNTSLNPYSYYD